MHTGQEPAHDGARVPGERAAAPTAASASEHVDRCIEAYAERCRRRVPTFIAEHVSLTRAWSTQRQTLWRDLMVAPLNSLWAIPYWTLRKVCVGLDALGVPGASDVLGRVKPGIASAYQRATDAALAREVLEWDLQDGSGRLPSGLLCDLEAHPALTHLRSHPQALPLASVRKVLDDHASARALVADLAGAGFTVLVSWVAFRSTALGLMDMANRFAQQDATRRAASRFFLGRSAGKAFFSVFRPNASPLEIALILAGLALVIACGSMLCALATEPLLSSLGLQQHRLRTLVDKVERELVVVFGTRVKSTLRTARLPEAREVGSGAGDAFAE